MAREGGAVYYNPQFQNIDQSGRIRGEALAKFGQDLGQSIAKSQERKKEKEQNEAAARMIAKNPSLRQFMGIDPSVTEEEVTKAFSSMDPADRNVFFKTMADVQQAKAQEMNAMANMGNAQAALERAGNDTAITNNALANSQQELAIRQKQAATNAMMAETAAEKAKLERESWQMNKDLIMGGDIPERILSDGTMLYWDTNSWKQGRGQEMNDYQKYSTLMKISDPEGIFMQYKRKTRNSKGERADITNPFRDFPGGEAKKEPLDPFIEKIFKDNGMPNFYDEAMKEAGLEPDTTSNAGKVKPSTVTPVSSAPQGAIDKLRANPGLKEAFIAKYGEDALPADMR